MVLYSKSDGVTFELRQLHNVAIYSIEPQAQCVLLWYNEKCESR